MKKHLLAATMATAAVFAHAESNPAKKELITKIVQLQQGAVDGVARMLTEQPVAVMMQPVGPAIQFRVVPEKREALGKEINADVKKYMDDVGPMLRERANKLAPGTMGAVFEDKFSEDELRQLIALMESPVLRKFSQMQGEASKALADKLLADTKAQNEPKFKALQDTIAKRVDTAIKASAAK